MWEKLNRIVADKRSVTQRCYIAVQKSVTKNVQIKKQPEALDLFDI